MRLWYLWAVPVCLGWWSLAWGHDFDGEAHMEYPAACCNAMVNGVGDCRALEAHEVEWTPDGWRITLNGQIIPFDAVPYGTEHGHPEYSPNPSFHACFLSDDKTVRVFRYGSNGGAERPCFWAPMTGV